MARSPLEVTLRQSRLMFLIALSTAVGRRRRSVETKLPRLVAWRQARGQENSPEEGPGGPGPCGEARCRGAHPECIEVSVLEGGGFEAVVKGELSWVGFRVEVCLWLGLNLRFSWVGL